MSQTPNGPTNGFTYFPTTNYGYEHQTPVSAMPQAHPLTLQEPAAAYLGSGKFDSSQHSFVVPQLGMSPHANQQGNSFQPGRPSAMPTPFTAQPAPTLPMNENSGQLGSNLHPGTLAMPEHHTNPPAPTSPKSEEPGKLGSNSQSAGPATSQNAAFTCTGKDTIKSLLCIAFCPGCACKCFV